MLEEEIQYLKLENKKLKENDNTLLKIVELLSENKRDFQNYSTWENVWKTERTTIAVTNRTNTNVLPTETRNSFPPLHIGETFSYDNKITAITILKTIILTKTKLIAIVTWKT